MSLTLNLIGFVISWIRTVVKTEFYVIYTIYQIQDNKYSTKIWKKRGKKKKNRSEKTCYERYAPFCWKKISSFPEMCSLSTAISAGGSDVLGFVLSFYKEFRLKLEIHLNVP